MRIGEERRERALAEEDRVDVLLGRGPHRRGGGRGERRNIAASLVIALIFEKRSHSLWNFSTAAWARGSASRRRACFSTPSVVASSPDSAAAKSVSSGMVFQSR